MKPRYFLAAAAAAALLGPCAYAQKTEFTTLKENIYICVSPRAYDDAMGRVKAVSGDPEPLRKELLETKQCMFVDAEMVDNIMAPYAIVLERNGSKVQVQFIITFRKRMDLLHRMINRYVLVGWTEESNLEKKTIL